MHQEMYLALALIEMIWHYHNWDLMYVIVSIGKFWIVLTLFISN